MKNKNNSIRFLKVLFKDNERILSIIAIVILLLITGIFVWLLLKNNQAELPAIAAANRISRADLSIDNFTVEALLEGEDKYFRFDCVISNKGKTNAAVVEKNNGFKPKMLAVNITKKK